MELFKGLEVIYYREEYNISTLVGIKGGFEVFERVMPEDVARKATERALLMLLAKPAPAGNFTVGLAGHAGGTMIHEAVGHGCEADLVQ